MGNFDINKAGFVIVGIFVLTWAAALAVWHFGHLEQKWKPTPSPPATARTPSIRPQAAAAVQPETARRVPASRGRRLGLVIGIDAFDLIGCRGPLRSQERWVRG